MWRWPTVAGQKEASAKAKAKTYSLHAKLITIAAESGADPSLNGALFEAIKSAKQSGVTADVIDRAVKRWAWLDKDASKVEEIIYEWYAPGGIWIIVRTLTDNKNRTAPSIRHIFGTSGGSMAESGSVSSFAFDFVGLITVEEPTSRDELEMAIMETSAKNYEFRDIITITTDRDTLMEVKKNLEWSGYKIKSALLTYLAKNPITLTDFDTALKLYTLLEAFDEDDDVENVYNSAEISDELWEQVRAFVESKRFRT